MDHRLVPLLMVAIAIATLPACASARGPGASVARSAEAELPTSRSTDPIPSSGNVVNSSPDHPGRSDSASGPSTLPPSSPEVSGFVAPAFAAPPLTCAGAKMGFAISLSIDMVGRSTPIEAARVYVTQPRSSVQNVPADAVWTVSGSDQFGVTVTTDALQLHAVRLPNQSWAIDSGEACNEVSAPPPTG